jgi:AraC-like DNA-binding protein
MLLKFPQITDDRSDKTFISFGNIPYAKHNIVKKSGGRQIGFLTEHSLLFIMQGKKFFHFGKKTITISQNELLLIKRGIYSISEFIPEDGFFEALIIFIPDKFLKTIAYENISNNTTENETQYIILKSNKFLDDFKSQYLNYLSDDFVGKEKLFKLKLQELFLLLASSSAKNSVADFLASCIRKEKIDIEYIVKTNLLQPLTISDFAKLSMRSLASFKRDFEKQFHTSPKRWINHQRIVYSNGLLNTTNKTVAEIAYECGFENVSHFIKLFKKEFEFTPQKVRAKSVMI